MQDILIYFSFDECSLPTFKSVVCIICKVYIWYDVLLFSFSLVSEVYCQSCHTPKGTSPHGSAGTLKFTKVPAHLNYKYSFNHSFIFIQWKWRRDGNQVCVLVQAGAGCLDGKTKKKILSPSVRKKMTYNWNHLFSGSLEVAETRCDCQHWHIYVYHLIKSTSWHGVTLAFIWVYLSIYLFSC